jgi:hypothetical protein
VSSSISSSSEWTDVSPVEVLVCNGGGLDDDNMIKDRALVAAHLYMAGIR